MNNTFNLTLSLNELNVILACLVKQPYEQVFSVVNSIQTQAQKQSTPVVQNQSDTTEQ